MEALLRWRHPERGEVSPVDFIPVAEETGLIHTIGEWVMREAFRQTREWQSLCPTGKALRVSVNLSGKQLQRRDIVSQVTGLLKETGLDPQLVQLEITTTRRDEPARIVLTFVLPGNRKSSGPGV